MNFKEGDPVEVCLHSLIKWVNGHYINCWKSKFRETFLHKVQLEQGWAFFEDNEIRPPQPKPIDPSKKYRTRCWDKVQNIYYLSHFHGRYSFKGEVVFKDQSVARYFFDEFGKCRTNPAFDLIEVTEEDESPNFSDGALSVEITPGIRKELHAQARLMVEETQTPAALRDGLPYEITPEAAQKEPRKVKAGEIRDMFNLNY